MTVRNQFSLFPWCATTKAHFVSFRMVMQNWKTCFFSTPLCNFSYFFIFNSPPPPSIQLQSLVQVHFLFLIIHTVSLLHSIFNLSLNASKITLIYLQNLTKKPLVSLARVAMYYLGILGIITTQKVWNSWELVSKMCGFWVVIRNAVWRYEMKLAISNEIFNLVFHVKCWLCVPFVSSTILSSRHSMARNS